MMKKTGLLLLLCLPLLLISCGKKPAQTTALTDSPETVTLPYKTEALPETLAPDALDPDAMWAQTVTEDFGQGASVSYDMLLTGDTELDELLAALSAERMRTCIPNASSVIEFGGSVDYTVRQMGAYTSGRLFCALFSGRYAVSFPDGIGGEESGEVFYTVNIDLETHKTVETPTLLTDYESMTAAFPEADFSAYRADYGVYPEVWLTDTDFCVHTVGTGLDGEGKTYTLPLSEAVVFLNERYR